MPITEKQRLQRRAFIGSSDMPAIMGVDKYRSAADIYWDKIGKIPLDEEAISDPAEAGNYLESSLLTWGADQLGVKIRRNQRRVKGRFAANLDALVVGRDEALEAKTTGLYNPFFEADEWGDMGTDEVPVRVVVQTHHQMYVADLARVWVPALVAGKGLMLYRIERDEDLIAEIIKTGERFWEHVEERVAPPDTLPGIETVKRLIREPNKTVEISNDAFLAYVAAKDALKEAQKAEEEAKRRLLAELSDAEAGWCDAGELTYYTQRQNRIDTTKLKQLYPEIVAEVTKESAFPVLRVKAR